MANTATGQSSADAAAQQRAAEEWARRRAAIQSQIQQWNTKLTTVNSQIAGLTAEQSNLSTYLGDWDTQKSIYSGSEILSEVCGSGGSSNCNCCYGWSSSGFGSCSGRNSRWRG